MKEAKNLQKVSLADYSIADLKKAAREGRLFIQPAEVSETEKRIKGISHIKQYVSRINKYTCSCFSEHIDSIWEQVIATPEVAAKLFITRQKTEGTPNFYLVNSIVSIMRENGVYDHAYTLLQLSKIMENTNEKPKSYKGRNSYFSNEIKKEVKSILKKYQQKKSE